RHRGAWPRRRRRAGIGPGSRPRWRRPRRRSGPTGPARWRPRPAPRWPPARPTCAHASAGRRSTRPSPAAPTPKPTTDGELLVRDAELADHLAHRAVGNAGPLRRLLPAAALGQQATDVAL